MKTAAEQTKILSIVISMTAQRLGRVNDYAAPNDATLLMLDHDREAGQAQ